MECALNVAYSLHGFLYANMQTQPYIAMGAHGQQQLDGYGALWLTMANVRYGETAIRGSHV